MPKVIIISAYHNRENLVDETLAGIAAQSYTDYQAYFYDDGSTDNTYEQLKKFESDKITAVKQNNIGLVTTFINAIGSTDSDYIAIQGSGDYSYPERIARQVEYMDSHPDCAVVGCYSEVVAPNETRYNKIDVQPNVIEQLYKENPFVQGETLIRRSAYEQCGGYRSFFTFRQDLDLWLRIAEHGRLHVLPEVMYRCYRVPNSVSLDVNKLYVAMACRNFAVYCSRERRAGRGDPLDKRGAVAALVRPRSKQLALAYQASARNFALQGKHADARVLLDASFNEYKTNAAVLTDKLLSNPRLMKLYLKASDVRQKLNNR